MTLLLLFVHYLYLALNFEHEALHMTKTLNLPQPKQFCNTDSTN